MSTLTPAPKRDGVGDGEEKDATLPESTLHAGLSPSLWATPVASRHAEAGDVGGGEVGQGDGDDGREGLKEETPIPMLTKEQSGSRAGDVGTEIAASAAPAPAAAAAIAAASTAAAAASVTTKRTSATKLEAVLRQKVKEPASKKYEWRERHFSLDQEQSEVVISSADTAETLQKLDLAQVGIVSEWGGANSERFDIALNSGDVISLKAKSTDEARAWVNCLNEAIDGQGGGNRDEEEEEEEEEQEQEQEEEEEKDEDEDEEKEEMEGGNENEDEETDAVDKQREKQKQQENQGQEQEAPSPILYVPMPSATAIVLPSVEDRGENETVFDTELVSAQLLEQSDLAWSFKETVAKDRKVGTNDESPANVVDVIKAAENGDDHDLALALTREELTDRTTTRRTKRSKGRPSYMSSTTASSRRGGKGKSMSRSRMRNPTTRPQTVRSSKRSFRSSRSPRSSCSARRAVSIPSAPIAVLSTVATENGEGETERDENKGQDQDRDGALHEEHVGLAQGHGTVVPVAVALAQRDALRHELNSTKRLLAAAKEEAKMATTIRMRIEAQLENERRNAKKDLAEAHKLNTSLEDEYAREMEMMQEQHNRESLRLQALLEREGKKLDEAHEE